MGKRFGIAAERRRHAVGHRHRLTNKRQAELFLAVCQRGEGLGCAGCFGVAPAASCIIGAVAVGRAVVGITTRGLAGCVLIILELLCEGRGSTLQGCDEG